jgi:hypothetical protein
MNNTVIILPARSRPLDPVGDAFQELHEQAHPDGTVFAAHCLEPSCRTLAEALDRAA